MLCAQRFYGRVSGVRLHYLHIAGWPEKCSSLDMPIRSSQSYTAKKNRLTSASKSAKITSTREAAMAAMRQAEAVLVKSPDRKLSGIGATEDQMNVRGAIPQRIDKRGTKIEDMAGTGEHDGSGG